MVCRGAETHVAQHRADIGMAGDQPGLRTVLQCDAPDRGITAELGKGRRRGERASAPRGGKVERFDGHRVDTFTDGMTFDPPDDASRRLS